ncbi:MAG: elongation factor P [Planctomycetota bacterium]|jgi:elongation factor P|nr:elongation factor P [Planctomycetota bacterium]
MVTIKANQCRKGQILVIDNELWVVTDYEFRKPGKGSSFNQIKLKNHSTGQQKSMRMSSDETLERAHLDKRACTFSYMDGDSFVFMDSESFEQYFLEPDMVGDTMKFVRDNQEIHLTFFESTPVAIDLPAAVILKVTEAEMAAKGNTVTQDKKRAVCETGLEVKVPPFVDAGEYIKVSTDNGEFMSRAKEEDI